MNQLSDQYEIMSYVKPGARIENLTMTAKTEISKLTKNDILIFWGGANEKLHNSTTKLLNQIMTHILNNQHTNIIIANIPLNYDVSETSSINNEIKSLNSKLGKLTVKLKHTKVISAEQQEISTQIMGFI
jgi:hypothetical protein